MKKILKKAEKIVYYDKTNKERIPIIYIRYFKGEVIYIGESSNYSSNRHSRIEEYSPFDRIRLLNAHKDTDIRRKWEAKLIVRLKPKMQRLDNYYRKASLDYKCSTDSSLIKTRNTRKIFLYLTKQYDAFIKIYEENNANVSLLKDQMIDLEREIYFGKTQLPLFKVYGAVNSTDTSTTTRLGTAKEFTEDERGKIEGAGFQWPVMGIRYTKEKTGKYYTIEATLLTGTDEKANEPTYTACRMGTNASKRYSFVIEGTHIKDWATFKKVFASDPAAKNW